MLSFSENFAYVLNEWPLIPSQFASNILLKLNFEKSELYLRTCEITMMNIIATAVGGF